MNNLLYQNSTVNEMVKESGYRKNYNGFDFQNIHETLLSCNVDYVNYVAVTLLEQLGIMEPSEALINKVEHFINKLLKHCN